MVAKDDIFPPAFLEDREVLIDKLLPLQATPGRAPRPGWVFDDRVVAALSRLPNRDHTSVRVHHQPPDDVINSLLVMFMAGRLADIESAASSAWRAVC